MRCLIADWVLPSMQGSVVQFSTANNYVSNEASPISYIAPHYLYRLISDFTQLDREQPQFKLEICRCSATHDPRCGHRTGSCARYHAAGRAGKNWSQAELAHQLGVSGQTVNAIERGKYDPSLPHAFKIAALFGKLIEEVFEPDESDARWKPHTMPIPILSIVGRSGSGKTTLLENIIVELKRRGYRLATIKHHAHSGFEIDQPGKDTWRHARAGSDLVIIAAPDKMATIRTLEHELTLDEIAAGIDGVDIILTEGYKRAGKPALEVVRAEVSTKPICNPDQLVALATDTELDTEVPQFHLQDVNQIVDFITSQLNIG